MWCWDFFFNPEPTECQIRFLEKIPLNEKKERESYPEHIRYESTILSIFYARPRPDEIQSFPLRVFLALVVVMTCLAIAVTFARAQAQHSVDIAHDDIISDRMFDNATDAVKQEELDRRSTRDTKYNAQSNLYNTIATAFGAIIIDVIGKRGLVWFSTPNNTKGKKGVGLVMIGIITAGIIVLFIASASLTVMTYPDYTDADRAANPSAFMPSPTRFAIWSNVFFGWLVGWLGENALEFPKVYVEWWLKRNFGGKEPDDDDDDKKEKKDDKEKNAPKDDNEKNATKEEIPASTTSTQV